MNPSKDSYFRAFRGKCISQRPSSRVWLVQFSQNQPNFPKTAIAKQYLDRTLDFDREVAILQSLNGAHENIVSYYHHIVAREDGYLFMEWCAKGCLALEIHTRSQLNQPWSDEELRVHFTGLIGAMKEIHSRRIVHRDLKPENVFITKEGVMKIGDFGESKQVRQGNTDVLATLRGTSQYISPEQQQRPFLSNADCMNADVWMLGRTFYEMAVCSRRPDLNSISPENAYEVYQEIERTLEQAGRAADVIQLIMSMIGLVERPSFAALQQALDSKPCGNCGADARRREPFPCGHVVCGSCLLLFLTYIKENVTSLEFLVCPFCSQRLSLAYFQRNDYDEATTSHVTQLYLQDKTFECPFCHYSHYCYTLSDGYLRPYLLTCSGYSICSLCQASGGHWRENCPRTTRN